MKAPPAPPTSFARWAAVGLVLVQCCVLGVLAQGQLFSIVMGVAATLSLWDRLQLSPRHTPRWGWFAALGILLAAKHRISPEVLDEQITFFHTVVGYEAARYLVFLQVVQLYVARPDGRLPFWFAGVACLAMVLGSNVRLNPATRPVSMLLCLAFVAALALFSAGNRRRMRVPRDRLAVALAGGALVAVLLGGLVTAGLLRRFEGRLERWLAERGGPDREDVVSPGFSSRGHLGDIGTWKQHAPEHIALRVRSESAPGYLRGYVFDSFADGTWAEASRVDAVFAIEPLRLSLPRAGEALYVLSDSASETQAGPPMHVWPDARTGDRMFVPLDALYLATQPTHLTITGNQQVQRRGSDAPSPYSVWQALAPQPQPLESLDRHRGLTLHEAQRPELTRIAAEITRGCRTTRDKAAAVADFFRQNFQYSLQGQWARGEDPVLRFLRERPAAHCEYFASAGALLLRSIDVPTRYVTGYVAAERNSVGDYWVARRKDAHAWLEAYDDASQTWFTVECTPAAGIPSGQNRQNWDEWWDARQLQLREWLHEASAAGVRGLAIAAGHALFTVPGLSVLLLGSAAAVFWKLRQRRSHLARIHDRPPAPLLWKQLQRGDRLARRLGFERGRSETLSMFARRLRGDEAAAQGLQSELADWYDDYVRVRYQSVEAAPADVLAARLRRIAGLRR